MEGSKTETMTEEEKKAKAGFDRNVNRLTTQVRETYKRAFFDLLQEKVAANPPDFEWLTRLYGEIRTKLISLLRVGSPLRVEIEESMDCDFFKQLISNNVFSPEDFYTLIRYVFEKCKQLGSPGRDKDVDEKFNELIEMMKNNAVFAEIVPVFIKNANDCIDWIYKDMSDFSKKISKK